MPDRVSVVVPIFNMEAYLLRCFHSLSEQTYPHLDIILVDDGSTDNSALMCQEFAKNDTRVTYIWQKNQGLGAARNTGIKEAKAKYITFLDADDWFEPAFIEKTLGAMAKFGCEIGLCDIYYVESESYKRTEVKIRFDQTVKSCQDDKTTLNKSRLFAWGKIYEKNLLDRIQFSFPHITYEDILIPLLILNAKQIAYVAEPLINYLRHRAGSLSNVEKNITDIGKGLTLLFNELNKSGMYVDYKGEFAKIAIGQLRFASRKWKGSTDELAKTIAFLLPELKGLPEKVFYADNGGVAPSALASSALDKALPYGHQVVNDIKKADFLIDISEELKSLAKSDDSETDLFNLAELMMEKIIKVLSERNNLVSVIVPIYNTAQYLNRCIDSILAQSYKKIELILIDDGSTDESGKICDEIAKQDQRVKVIHQANQGLSGARNAGLLDAKGEYITFVDSDDLLPQEAINYQMAKANKDMDLIIGDANVIGNENMGSYWSLAVDEYSKVEYCFEMVEKKAGWLSNVVWGKLYKSSIIKQNSIKFRDNAGTWEDSAFNLEYLTYVTKIANVKKPVYNYFRYDEADRVTLSTVLYFDVYEFYFGHAQNLWKMVSATIPDGKKTVFCSKIVDQLIIYLVHAMVGEKYIERNAFKKALKGIVQNETMRTLITHYVRANPEYSVLIPFFIKNKCHHLLYFALKDRAKKYRKTRKVANEIKSIYWRKTRIYDSGF
ncbi:MAG: glycosyltransferase family 2 protein [Lachnospiraceae bacterium]|nr:glycosyltransferase family 2 protein [Lachnospiraceae bacterium]